MLRLPIFHMFARCSLSVIEIDHVMRPVQMSLHTLCILPYIIVQMRRLILLLNSQTPASSINPEETPLKRSCHWVSDTTVS